MRSKTWSVHYPKTLKKMVALCLFYFSLDILMVGTPLLVCITRAHSLTQTPPHTSYTQLNAWSVFNWENESNMTQKQFILSAAMGMLVESDCRLAKWLGNHTNPDNDDDDTDSPSLLSPTAAEQTPAARFFCTKQEMASITKSRKYK